MGGDRRMGGAASRLGFRGGGAGAGVPWAACSVSWSFGCFRCCVLVSSCGREEAGPSDSESRQQAYVSSFRRRLFEKAVDVCFVIFALYIHVL